MPQPLDSHLVILLISKTIAIDKCIRILNFAERPIRYLNTLGEVGHYPRNRLKSMQWRPTLITAIWKQAELQF